MKHLLCAWEDLKQLKVDELKYTTQLFETVQLSNQATRVQQRMCRCQCCMLLRLMQTALVQAEHSAVVAADMSLFNCRIHATAVATAATAAALQATHIHCLKVLCAMDGQLQQTSKR
jgi:hypothetical protein